MQRMQYRWCTFLYRPIPTEHYKNTSEINCNLLSMGVHHTRHFLTNKARKDRIREEEVVHMTTNASHSLMGAWRNALV